MLLSMPKSRLEAFSDGVIAVIITIMVLELKHPVGADLSDLGPLVPGFLSYVMSFVYVGIYWGNHHHLIQAADHVNAATMWANLHLLFWMSLIPLVTAWFGSHPVQRWPTAVYGIVLLLAANAYFVLQWVILRSHPDNDALAEEFRTDWKRFVSVVGYATAVVMAFVLPVVAVVLYVALAALWFVPDRRAARAAQA